MTTFGLKAVLLFRCATVQYRVDCKCPQINPVVYQPGQDPDSVKIQGEGSTEDGHVRAPPSAEQDHITAKVTCASISSGGIQR